MTVIRYAPSVRLHTLRRIRLNSNLSDQNIVDIMTSSGRHPGFTKQRLKNLSTGRTKSEPWYDEARDLSRLLLLDGILPLMSDMDLPAGEPYPSGTLTTFNIVPCDDATLSLLRNGARLTLGVACSIAAHFGLDDPIELEQHPRLVELWAALGSGERDGSARCPWCLQRAGAGAAHLPTCVGDNLLGERVHAPWRAAHAPKPARASGKRESGVARGLKAMREAAKLTQPELARRAGIPHMTYISKLETGTLPLTDKKANQIAAALRCRVEDLYAAPEGEDT